MTSKSKTKKSLRERLLVGHKVVKFGTSADRKSAPEKPKKERTLAERCRWSGGSTAE